MRDAIATVAVELLFDRHALNRLRDRVRLGEYERVLVTDPHRLSRDGALLWAMIKELESVGC